MDAFQSLELSAGYFSASGQLASIQGSERPSVTWIFFLSHGVLFCFFPFQVFWVSFLSWLFWINARLGTDCAIKALASIVAWIEGRVGRNRQSHRLLPILFPNNKNWSCSLHNSCCIPKLDAFLHKFLFIYFLSFYYFSYSPSMSAGENSLHHVARPASIFLLSCLLLVLKSRLFILRLLFCHNVIAGLIKTGYNWHNKNPFPLLFQHGTGSFCFSLREIVI